MERLAIEKYESETELDNTGLEEILETLMDYLEDEGIDCELERWGYHDPGWDLTCHAIKITGNSDYDFSDENEGRLII